MSSNTIKVDMVLSQFLIDCTDYESCKLNWNCIEMKGEKVMLIHKLNKYILKVINLIYFYFWSDCYEYKRFICIKNQSFFIYMYHKEIYLIDTKCTLSI